MQVNPHLKVQQFQATTIARPTPSVNHSLEHRLGLVAARFDAIETATKGGSTATSSVAATKPAKPAGGGGAAAAKAPASADKPLAANATIVTTESLEVALGEIFEAGIKAAFPEIPAPAALITQGKATEYQCNNAMGIAKALSTLKPPVKLSPKEVGAKLVAALPANDLVGEATPTDQGFINITVRRDWVCKAVQRVMARGVQPPAVTREKVLVDFSSPNIAKDMHVGHLRSTIIGDCICRLFEFLGHDVRRINHVGDWGTQFGMLILYMKRNYPDFLTVPPPITDLVVFYKASKQLFDEDPSFKEQARLEVVKLQALEETSIKAWKLICDISRREFEEVYEMLQIRLEERGESYYNPIIPDTLKALDAAGQIEKSDGASIIVSKEARPLGELDAKLMTRIVSAYLVQVKRDGTTVVNAVLLAAMRRAGVLVTNEAGEETLVLGKKDSKPWAKFDAAKDADKLAKAIEPLYKPALDGELRAELEKLGVVAGASVKVPRFAFPLIAQKSDGGYTYDTTDLAAMWHRFCVEKYSRVVYVTDVGQFEHFRMVAQVAEDMGWMANARWAHAGFGLVSGADGKKLKTRSGETTKLRDLLNEACERAYATLAEREADPERRQGHSEEEMRRLSKAIGFGAVKYFDLKQNRTTDYTFSYDKMLDPNGNTAVYLLYSYARICSIKRKAGVSDDVIRAVTPIVMEHEEEKQLALTAFRFASVLTKTSEDLCPHHLTDFAYELVGKFSDFFRECKVVGHELQNSRLALIELVRVTLQITLNILGINVIDKM